MRRVISTHTPPRSPAPPHVSARRPAPIPSLFIRPHPAGRPPPLFPPPPYAGGRNGVPASHEHTPPPGLSPHASPQAVTAARALRRLPPPPPPQTRAGRFPHIFMVPLGPRLVLSTSWSPRAALMFTASAAWARATSALGLRAFTAMAASPLRAGPRPRREGRGERRDEGRGRSRPRLPARPF